MRISEKTIEINFCAQFASRYKFPIFWFGLTQKQEASAGFDVCSKIGGRLFVLQFKASNKVLKGSGRRRFHLPHDQLTSLQSHVSHHSRSVFYVFPLVGSTFDISQNPDLITQSRLLDVASIPSMATPTTKSGSPRKSRIHYADVNSNTVILHSDPVELELTDPNEFVKRGFIGTDGISSIFKNSSELFWEFARELPRNTVGVVIGATERDLSAT